VSDAQLRDAICSQVAKLLRETRQDRGLSMTQLAERAGLSRAMVSFVEREIRNPTLETLLRMCAALDIQLADILSRATRTASKSKDS